MRYHAAELVATDSACYAFHVNLLAMSLSTSKRTPGCQPEHDDQMNND